MCILLIPAVIKTSATHCTPVPCIWIIYGCLVRISHICLQEWELSPDEGLLQHKHIQAHTQTSSTFKTILNIPLLGNKAGAVLWRSGCWGQVTGGGERWTLLSPCLSFGCTRFGPLCCPEAGPQRLTPPKVSANPLSIRSSVSTPSSNNLLLLNFPTTFIYYSAGDLF